MAEVQGKINIYLFMLAAAVLFAGCANQLAPGGGEIDRIPPEIVETYPADGAVNFNDEYIEFGFS
jgi:PBP1b-binding outer membrane lipoprotein LpoB